MVIPGVDCRDHQRTTALASEGPTTEWSRTRRPMVTPRLDRARHGSRFRGRRRVRGVLLRPPSRNRRGEHANSQELPSSRVSQAPIDFRVRGRASRNAGVVQGRRSRDRGGLRVLRTGLRHGLVRGTLRPTPRARRRIRSLDRFNRHIGPGRRKRARLPIDLAAA